MKKILLGTLIISVLAVSCKKDDNDGGGNGGGGYMTYDAGKSWTYERNSGGTLSTFSLLSTGRDTTFSVAGQTKTYKIFSRSGDETGNEYYKNQGNEYFRLQNFLGSNAIEFKYLVDNLAEGQTWPGGSVNFTQPFNQSFDSQDTIEIPNPLISGQTIRIPPGTWEFQGTLNLSINLNNSIERKDTSMTVSDVNFDNVIKVRTVPTVNNVGLTGVTVDPPGFLPAIPLNPTIEVTLNSDISSYYGKIAGLILEKNKLDFSAEANFFGQTIPVPAVTLSDYILKLKSKNF